MPTESAPEPKAPAFDIAGLLASMGLDPVMVMQAFEQMAEGAATNVLNRSNLLTQVKDFIETKVPGMVKAEVEQMSGLISKQVLADITKAQASNGALAVPTVPAADAGLAGLLSNPAVQLILSKLLGGGAAAAPDMSALENMAKTFSTVVNAFVQPAMELRQSGFQDALRTVETMSKARLPLNLDQQLSSSQEVASRIKLGAP